jgi:glycosyltransferase involved in cell wall biosynthesis
VWQAVKIFGWALNHSGCGQYRIGLPMWALAQAGHDATAFSVLNMELPPDLDVLVGQQVFGADRGGVWRNAASTPGRTTALVFETDDDVWNLHGTNQEALGFRDPELMASLEDSIRCADAVSVTTTALGEQISRLNQNVHVLPNCIDEALLRRERRRNDRLTIGWAGGSSHHNDFAFAGKELRTFFRRNPEVELHIVGADFRAQLGRPRDRLSMWSENLVDYLARLDFDIGIAPLAYHAFNRSKSDIKVLEYAALGIPVVATDYGPYSDSVQHGVTGFLVKRPHEWERYLRELVNDEAMRLEMGANAKRWAATRTIQGNIWRWEEAYRSAVGTAEARALTGPAELRERIDVATGEMRAPRTDSDALGSAGARKVFVIGHNKTGTTSVEAALASLGLRMGDQARGELLLDDWARGRYDRIIELGESADAFQDIPFSLWGTYRALDGAFPGARFILTVRGSSQEWYRSTLAWGRQLTHAAGPVPTAAEMRAFTYRAPEYFLRAHKLIYGVDDDSLYDEARYVAAYERHNRDVMNYFENRPESLLVLNVASPDAMAQIRRFLGLDDLHGVGDSSPQMPWLNRTEDASRLGIERGTVAVGEQVR